MSRDRRLGFSKDEYHRREGAYKTHLVLQPMDTSDSGILGLLSRYEFATAEIVYLCAMDGRSTIPQIARFLALITIDSQAPLLLHQLMPSAVPHAILFANSSLRHSRSRTFSPSELDEIGRVTSELLYRHEPFLRGCHAVLNGKPATGFYRLPRQWLFDDPVGTARVAPTMPSVEVSASLREALSEAKPWDGRVKNDYARDRFMRGMSRDALAKRTMDILSNLRTTRDDDRTSSENRDVVQAYWFSRFAEVYVELEHRGAADRAALNELIKGEKWVGSFIRSGHLFEGELNFPADLDRPYLVKYEKKEYLVPMLERGCVRISPASRYQDASLNVAVRDNELEAELLVTPLQRGGFGGLPGPLAAGIQERRPMIKTLGTNYYVYCCSTRAVTRLAHDFERDACLVIRDPAEFTHRLDRAVRNVLGDWRFVQAQVEYYDPLAVSEIEVDVLMWKHFRFAYQEETRFAWLPPSTTHKLEPIDVELGSLTDICELVEPSQKTTLREIGTD